MPGTEQAIFFENRHGQRLFGVLNEVRKVDKAPPLGVVFCHPIGWEKNNSYRPYVRFARFLGTLGFPSLRFDYHGFGDSAGDSGEATVDTQISDTADAIAKLARESAVPRIVLIGARFGATIASLAATQDERVRGLVLVSPIVSGIKYWNALLRAHQLALLTSNKGRSRIELLDDIEAQGRLELDAEYLSAQMIHQISEVDLVEASAGRPKSCIVTALASQSTDREDIASLVSAYQQHGWQVTAWLDEDRDFWTNESNYAGYVPTRFYERTATWLRTLAQ